MPKLPVLVSRTTWMIYSKRRDILSINTICPHINHSPNYRTREGLSITIKCPRIYFIAINVKS